MPKLTRPPLERLLQTMTYGLVLLLVGALLSGCTRANSLSSLTGPPATTAAPRATAAASPAPAATLTRTPSPQSTPPSVAAARYAAPDCDYGGLLKSIEALNALTVRFTMCAPDASFPAKAALASLAIHPSEYLEATGGSGKLLTNPIGTGPYKLESWAPGDSIKFKRNDDYWGEKAQTETLVFRWSRDATMRLLELRAGAVDGMDLPASDDFQAIKEDATLKLYPRPALNVFYLGMNRDIPPLDNDLVRQALAMGIDRQRIVDHFFPPGSEVASHFTPCTIPGGCAGDAWYAFDQEAARELLRTAGFPDGFEIELTYRDVFRPYLPEPAAVAQEIQNQLRELGVKASLRSMESGAFLEATSRGELPLYMLGWSADYPDPASFLDVHFGEGATQQFGQGYEDIWSLLERASRISDPAARSELYGEANTLIKSYAPMAPIAHGGNATVFGADVEGAYASPLMAERFAVMKPGNRSEFIWLQGDEPLSLYCADEEDGETLRACGQVNESLLAYAAGGTDIVPGLAESWESNANSTVWTFHLREGVKFHDGSDLDAGDVVLSYAVQWDAAHPLHVGRTGAFNSWTHLFQQFLNAPLVEG